MPLPIALISLHDQEHRRALLEMRGVPSDLIRNYFPAIDGRAEAFSTHRNQKLLDKLGKRYGRTIQNSELACAQSHQLAALWLARSRFDMMLVLEDDVIPSSADAFEKVMLVALSLRLHARKRAWICHLGPKPNQVNKIWSRKVVFASEESVTNPELHLHCDPEKGLWRAHAYLVSRIAAERVLSQEGDVNSLADDFCLLKNLGLLDEIFYCNPRVFRQDEEIESTIGHAFRRSHHQSLEHCGENNRGGGIGVSQSRPIKRFMASLSYRSRKLAARVLSKVPYRIA